jgi:hypothetical protein
MNPHVKTEFGTPDPNATPLNLVQLIQLLNGLVITTIEGSYQPYVLQNGTPNADDQDKVWIEKDSQGRPVSIKVYWSGSWRRIYNGMLGEIRAFHGAPGYSPEGHFNATGLGNVGGEYDGWALCNGKNGTPDFSDKFLVGAHMNKSDSHNDYEDGEWLTWADPKTGQHTGGVHEFILNEKTSYQPTVDIGTLKIGRYKIDSGGEDLDKHGLLWGKPSVGNEDNNEILKIQSEGNPTPDAVSVLNPFIALGWIIFIGYQS